MRRFFLILTLISAISISIDGKELSPLERKTTLAEKYHHELETGQWRKAMHTAMSYGRHLKKHFPEDRQEYIYSLIEVAKLANELNSSYYTKLYSGKVCEEYTDYLKGEFKSNTEAVRSSYWDRAWPYYSSTMDLNYDLSMPSRAGDLSRWTYDAVLFSKGLLLNTSIQFSRHVLDTEDAQAISLLEKMNALSLEGGRKREIEECDSLLICRLEAIGKTYPVLRVITWEDVRDALGPDDLAVEFYRDSRGNYGALLLRRDWVSPLSIRLKNIAGKNVWKRIIRYFPRTSQGRIYFSPDGELNFEGIEYLPFIKGPSGEKLSISDCFPTYRLSSTRRIVEMASEDSASPSRAGLYGGMMFTAPLSEVVMAADSVARMPERTVFRDAFGEEIILYADGIDGAFLPMSLAEVLRADSTIVASDRNIASELFTGVYAAKEAFKVRSGGENMIHIATHGYYQPSHAIADPMFRSGLKFSGSDAPETLDSHGLLSSKEISLLNLSQADLVILSACKTASGKLERDGVFGLQRAFKRAGTRTIIMTLKNVDDDAAECFMKEFYSCYITRGMDKTASFNSARGRLKTEFPEESDSFIMLDP